MKAWRNWRRTRLTLKKNIADLLEDDEEPIPEETKVIAEEPRSIGGIANKISSNLSQLLKGESSKKTLVDDSSDDDFMTRPVPQQKKNKKQKKQKGQVLSLEEFHRTPAAREMDSGSAADSESEKVSDKEGVTTTGDTKDGWSFEVDEEDVNKLLETEESPADAAGASEERTDLEDVFRFDSEMQDVEDGEEEKDSETKKSVSVDDLNDALMEETTDESEAEGAAASDVPSKEGEEAGVDIAETSKPSLGTSVSSSYGSSMASSGESSTANSPNPRNTQNKNKNKKGKKKKK